ncbi:MAG: prolipoprotein diacylglyceryl transferase [Acidimicrobiales bacterium]
MKPVPIAFHLGPLDIHTYGIGLAITFWFGLVYTNRRLRARGIPTDWMNRAFLWIVAAAIVGARFVHVLANIHFYVGHPGDIVAVWHGGLSSYGGLLFAVPTGLWFARRHCRQLFNLSGMDFVAPVLMAAWAMGRILGPNFEINGGGLPTTAWYGLRYAGQAGYRIPVPIFQCLESIGVFLVLLAIERWVRANRGPAGLVFFAMIGFWDVGRFFDEYAWLNAAGLWDAVEGLSILLVAIGFVGMAVVLLRSRRRRDAGALDDLTPAVIAAGTVPLGPGGPGPADAEVGSPALAGHRADEGGRGARGAPAAIPPRGLAPD